MADTVTPEMRSRMMAAIKGKDTKPELLIRKGLHAAGFRFRLHDRKLPGRPDLVFPKWRAVIFVNGCFWHGHECRHFRWPKTRTDFWRQKITANRQRDFASVNQLIQTGWRVAVIWSCALDGRTSADSLNAVAEWLRSEKSILELIEKDVGPMPS